MCVRVREGVIVMMRENEKIDWTQTNEFTKCQVVALQPIIELTIPVKLFMATIMHLIQFYL